LTRAAIHSDQSEAEHAGLVDRIDRFRMISRQQDDARRAELGQYLTPPDVARFMAGMFSRPPREVRLLDAGAGIGTLTAAFVEAAVADEDRPASIHAVLYELDTTLSAYLGDLFVACEEYCARAGVQFAGDAHQADFVALGVASLRRDLFASSDATYNRAILNPPYAKIHSQSAHRLLLRKIGVETTNLYAGFLAIVINLLEPGGELVAITPRSFCNGPYFRPFRQLLLRETAIRRIHVFEARDQAFGDDDVLQENVIFHLEKNGARGRVLISRAHGVGDDTLSAREVAHDEVAHPGDADLVIHIPANGMDRLIMERLASCRRSLDQLGLSVSTGRVVEFRATDALRAGPAPDALPLIHPRHLKDGFVRWPVGDGRKPEALAVSPATADLFIPAGYYVLVKRFSSKEEKRRIVAATLDPTKLRVPQVGLENHLNYYHARGAELPRLLALGLSVYLNSTLIDAHFRQFSGHTQVNATDLRMLRYPERDALERLGARVGAAWPDQQTIDGWLEEELIRMADVRTPDPILAKRKIDEALSVLRLLGLPRGQLNERSALTLLALLDLQPGMAWAHARSRMIGITPIMDFCRDHYGTTYAPNTRETFRRQTMHQFQQAGLVVANPDDPDRPVNSPKWCYQVEPATLRLLRSYGSEHWERNLEKWRASAESLAQRYSQERAMNRVPVRVAEGVESYLTPGKHSLLIRAIVEEFAARFAPGGSVLYLGDAGAKWAFVDREALAALGVRFDEHGKMPDVVIFDSARNWLFLVEAVTSHGPVDPKRHAELAALFTDAKAGLIYVTAFLTRRDMAKYASEISWETEVWVAEAETHLIHFDGDRFLGPHDPTPPHTSEAADD
jgi:adenine-specific DNA-methyltransferase